MSLRRTSKYRKNWCSYRSGLEELVANQIKAREGRVRYELKKISYTVPSRVSKYTPDFVLNNGIIIETKGEFSVSDRKKHLLIKAQYPDLDLRFVFQNPNAKLYKGSKTTYAMWCEANGFKWAKKIIPEEWFLEKKK